MDEAYLEVPRGTGAERIPLRGARVTIGRTADNAVALVEDPAVSGVHAVLDPTPNKGWQVYDAGSAGGTYVNGVRVTVGHVLHDGDVIGVGAARIAFRGGGSAGAAPAPAEAAAAYLDVSEEWGGAAAGPPAQRRGSIPEPRRQPQAPPPARPVSTGSRPAAKRRGKGHVRGVARSVQIRRTSDGKEEVLTLRVDRYDSSGNRLAPVGVEFRGYKGGHIADGEDVEVVGKWKRGTLRAKKIVNLSTHAEVQGRGAGTSVARGFAYLMFFLVFFSVLGFIAWTVLGEVL